MCLTEDIPSIICNIDVSFINNDSPITCDDLLYKANIELHKIKPL